MSGIEAQPRVIFVNELDEVRQRNSEVVSALSERQLAIGVVIAAKEAELVEYRAENTQIEREKRGLYEKEEDEVFALAAQKLQGISTQAFDRFTDEAYETYVAYKFHPDRQQDRNETIDWLTGLRDAMVGASDESPVLIHHTYEDGWTRSRAEKLYLATSLPSVGISNKLLTVVFKTDAIIERKNFDGVADIRTEEEHHEVRVNDPSHTYQLTQPEKVTWLDLPSIDSQGRYGDREIKDILGIVRARQLLGLHIDKDKFTELHQMLSCDPRAALQKLVAEALA